MPKPRLLPRLRWILRLSRAPDGVNFRAVDLCDIEKKRKYTVDLYLQYGLEISTTCFMCITIKLWNEKHMFNFSLGGSRPQGPQKR